MAEYLKLCDNEPHRSQVLLLTTLTEFLSEITRDKCWKMSQVWGKRGNITSTTCGWIARLPTSLNH